MSDVDIKPTTESGEPDLGAQEVGAGAITMPVTDYTERSATVKHIAQTTATLKHIAQ